MQTLAPSAAPARTRPRVDSNSDQVSASIANQVRSVDPNNQLQESLLTRVMDRLQESEKQYRQSERDHMEMLQKKKDKINTLRKELQETHRKLELAN